MHPDDGINVQVSASRSYRPADPLSEGHAAQLLTKHLLTVDEAARLLSVSRRTVINWLKLDAEHENFLPSEQFGGRLLRIPTAAVKAKLARLLPSAAPADPGDPDLEGEIIRCCRRRLTLSGTPVWSDWRLLAAEKALLARTLRRLAAMTRETVETRGCSDDCWLIAANTQAPGPYVCPALQALLGWRAAYLVNPVAGAWMLHPDPEWSGRDRRGLNVVLCDGVRDTGDHLQRAFNYIKSRVGRVSVAAVSVVYDNLPHGTPTMDFDHGNRDVPVVSVVRRGEEPCEIDSKAMMLPGQHRRGSG